VSICISESQRLFNGYKKSRVNDNQPTFSIDQKKSILNKLNEAVSFENFYTQNTLVKKFSLEGGESIIPALDTLIEKLPKWEWNNL
jgi:2-oxoglutarate dehydrogenase E1 component